MEKKYVQLARSERKKKETLDAALQGYTGNE
jgi:hypothetical protein